MLEKLQGIIRQYTDNDEITVTGNMLILTDLGLNSYELVQIVCDIEGYFGVEVPDRVISGFRTIQDVVDYIAAEK